MKAELSVVANGRLNDDARVCMTDLKLESEST